MADADGCDHTTLATLPARLLVIDSIAVDANVQEAVRIVSWLPNVRGDLTLRLSSTICLLNKGKHNAHFLEALSRPTAPPPRYGRDSGIFE
jgi:hypothetical protein